MIDFFSRYTLQDIVTFVVLLALAIKGGIEFWDWAWKRLKHSVKKGEEVNNLKEELLERIAKGEQETRELLNKEAALREKQVAIRDKQMEELRETQICEGEKVNQLHSDVKLLIDSDKDNIKAWITDKHHYFVMTLGEIDNFSLDCIEKRFQHYIDENGNSFVEDLMEDLRALPKIDASKALNERKRKREEAARVKDEKT